MVDEARFHSSALDWLPPRRFCCCLYRIRRRGRCEFKSWQVVPFGNLDQYRIPGTFQFVVFLQLLPQPINLDPDNGIRLWVEIRPAAKRFNADGVFLHLFRVFFQRSGGEKTEQLLQSWCALEGFGSSNPVHLVLRKW